MAIHPQPPQASFACKLEISLAGELLQTLNFDQDVITIGRDSSCDVVIDNLGVSRIHAQIKRMGNFFVVEDKNSKTGVFVRGKRIREYNLNDGDEFFLGKHIIRFQRSSYPSLHSSYQLGGSPRNSTSRQVMMQTMAVDFSGMAQKLGPAPAHLHNLVGSPPRIPLQKSVFSIGRAEECDLQIQGFLFARKHVLIVQERKNFVLHHLSRFRPPLLNDQKVKGTAILHDGDTITIGNQRLIFQKSFEEES